jgi:predicted nucleotidyltransferase
MNQTPSNYEFAVSGRIDQFQKILDSKEDGKTIVQKHIVHGTPYIFKDDEDKYFDLKRKVASNFSEHYTNIYMVGSAKLGFSIAPRKLWKPFDMDSDIDIVIISPKLFELLWEEIHEFNIALTSRSEKEEEKYKRFLDYFFRGWIRPDLFPFNYSKKVEWFNFFSSISYDKYGERKITGAIYHSFSFFEQYHISNIANLRLGAKENG